MTAEERAFAMEELLKEEEARIHQVEKELARLREIQVRSVQNYITKKKLQDIRLTFQAIKCSKIQATGYEISRLHDHLFLPC